MDASIQAAREQSLSLLEATRNETRALLSGLDPELTVHTDERAWRVRDVVGHLGVWNWEAARSLRAHAEGSDYHCIDAEEQYYDYNGPAAQTRRAWTMEQVWAEYDSAHEELRSLVESMPEDKWNGTMLYPWNARGTVQQLIEFMMTHERVEHCALIEQSIAG
jgi:hypothetical protein